MRVLKMAEHGRTAMMLMLVLVLVMSQQLEDDEIKLFWLESQPSCLDLLRSDATLHV